MKDYLEKKLVTDMQLCICGDFNFHLENNNDRSANSFNDIIDSFNLKQHVIVPTHLKGHICYLILTRCDASYANETNMSDHLKKHGTFQFENPNL